LITSTSVLVSHPGEQVETLHEQVRDYFGRLPDAEIHQSQPGKGATLGALAVG
jgi:hypothetical protein